MTLKTIIQNIKSLKIQGAQKIAFSALEALNITVHKSKVKTPKQLLKELANAQSQLNKARATEPLLRNYTQGALNNINTESIRTIRESVLANIAKLRTEHKKNFEEVVRISELKIPRGSTIYTHCHSSTVTQTLLRAHKKKKRIIVTNTETRPRYQGRKTATELSNAGIKVHHFVDSSVQEAIKHADLMMIGADAITPSGVINKIGSDLFCEMAYKHDVPIYICTHSLKFDPHTIYGKTEKIEQRDPDEVWKQRPRNVKIHNPAFEEINPKLITGIISELGIFPHAAFMQEVRRMYPWVFE